MEKNDAIHKTDEEASTEKHSDDDNEVTRSTNRVISPPSYSSISQHRTTSPPTSDEDISYKDVDDGSMKTGDEIDSEDDETSSCRIIYGQNMEEHRDENAENVISQDDESDSSLSEEDVSVVDNGGSSHHCSGARGAGGDYSRDIIESADIFKLCEWGQFNKKKYHALLNLLYKLMNTELKNSSIKIVNNYRSLYVHQEEYANVAKNDVSVNIVGTEFMTTCHSVIITHSLSGSSSLGHFSHPGDCAYNTLVEMIQGILSIDAFQYEGHYGTIEIQLYGGFKDKISRHLTYFLCQSLQKIQNVYGWKLKITKVLVSDMNNEVIDQLNQPILRSVALNLETGDVFRCKFASREPDEIIRSARHYSTPHIDKMYNIYNSITGQVSFGPHNWPTPEMLKNYMIAMSNHEDNLLRSLTSSSPEQEDDEYLDRWREVLYFINNYSFKNIFKYNKPRIYCRSDDNEKWLLVPL